MKQITLFIAVLLLTGGIYGQQTTPKGKPVVVSGATTVVTASKFQVTKPLNTLFTPSQIDKMDFKGAKEMPDREHRIPQKFLFSTADGSKYGNNPSTIQSQMGTKKSIGVKTQWEAQNGGASPQDPSGAAGLT